MDYPVKRNLDGCYFRVTRDDKVENVCFTDLTPEEREKIIRDRSAEWLSSLLCHVLIVIARLPMSSTLNLCMISQNIQLGSSQANREILLRLIPHFDAKYKPSCLAL